MHLKELLNIIDGELVCGDIVSESPIKNACASDLMSDVLTLKTDSVLLITGLVNMQTIRTAEMADIKYILFVRNKKPTGDMISLAEKEGINIILSTKSMFATCGILANAGIKAVY